MNPATNSWRGQDSTALRLIGALVQSQPFYCHDGAPFNEEHGWAVDPKTAPLCAGYFVLLSADAEQTKALIRKALTASFNEVYGDDESLAHRLDSDDAFYSVSAQLIEAVA